MDDNQNVSGQNQPDSFENRLNNVNQEPAPASQPVAPTSAPMPGGPTVSPAETRTMSSDINSAPTFTPQGMEDTAEPIFSPNAASQSSNGGVLEPEIRTGGSRVVWWMGGIIVGVIILALVGYFVVYPMLNSATPETPVDVPTGQGMDQTPTEIQHQSAFALKPASTVEVAIGDQIDDAVLAALLLREGGQTAAGSVTEVVFAKNDFSVMAFSEFMSVLAPSSNDATTLSGLFEEDFTLFLYRDNAGLIWPGYVGTLKADADPNKLDSWFKALEAGQLKELFLVDPGQFSVFKNGEAMGIPDRYAAGTTAGASFGYLANENKILIGTSFNGMKEAIRLMGWAQ